MIQVNRIYLIFNRLVTKKFLVDTSGIKSYMILMKMDTIQKNHLFFQFLLRVGKILEVISPSVI